MNRRNFIRASLGAGASLFIPAEYERKRAYSFLFPDRSLYWTDDLARLIDPGFPIYFEEIIDVTSPDGDPDWMGKAARNRKRYQLWQRRAALAQAEERAIRNRVMEVRFLRAAPSA